MPSAEILQLLREAEGHYHRGDRQSAEAVWRLAAERDPGCAPAFHGVGWVKYLAGDPAGAVTWITRAVERTPDFAPYHNDLGIVLAAAGHREAAERAYRRALELAPQFAEAHLNRGNLLRDQERWPEAVEVYRAAVSARPSFVEAHHALATALRESGRVQEALRSYEAALRLRPNSAEVYNDVGVTYARAGDADHAAAALQNAIRLKPTYSKPYRNLAALLLRLGRHEQALPVLSRLVELEPNAAGAHNDLGTVLARTAKTSEAIAAFRKAIALNADLGPAYANLGLTLEDSGDLDGAVAALRQAARLMPESSVVAYHLGALGAGTPPATCPPEYVIDLFDNYSGRFEQHLVGALGYRGPELLLEAVRAAGPSVPLDVLDLGCGTGLCGVLFRPMARRLVGIDLAPRMIAASKERDIYDELVQSDIVPAMHARRGEFDLLLAADLFIYVGDLTATFRAAAVALRPGGLLAFTVESIDEGDFVLRPTRRYAHSLAYLRRVAGENGLEQLSVNARALRAGEQGEVLGMTVLLRRN